MYVGLVSQGKLQKTQTDTQTDIAVDEHNPPIVKTQDTFRCGHLHQPHVHNGQQIYDRSQATHVHIRFGIPAMIKHVVIQIYYNVYYRKRKDR